MPDYFLRGKRQCGPLRIFAVPYDEGSMADLVVFFFGGGRDWRDERRTDYGEHERQLRGLRTRLCWCTTSVRDVFLMSASDRNVLCVEWP